MPRLRLSDATTTPSFVTNTARRPRLPARVKPRSQPRTMSAVAQASAAMAVGASTVTEARSLSSGAPRWGSIVCETRAAADLRDMAVVAGGCDRAVAEFDHTHEGARVAAWTFVANRPGPTVCLPPGRAQLSVDTDEPGRHAELRHHARELVDAEALGDRAEVEAQRREPSGSAQCRVELESLWRMERRPAGERRDGVQVRRAGAGAESPGLDEIADADVERAVG